MKKICIVTITNSCNFGNRLQNFALQEKLKETLPDVQVDTVCNVESDIAPLRKPMMYKLAEYFLSRKVSQIAANKVVRNAMLAKKIAFVRFNRRYIHWSRWTISKKVLPKAFRREYDYYICGSDQIWNPEFHFNSAIEYLSFAGPEKRIAYAGSFGVEELDEAHAAIAAKELAAFGPDAVSVRENTAADLIERLGLPRPGVVLDPTMLYDRKWWEKWEKKPSFAKDEAYALIYVLGREEKDKAYAKAKEKGLKVIDIYDQRNIEQYSMDPFEFVYLIHHARLVYTDSFHAMVFSILFHIDVYIMMRSGMTSRIDTLFQTIGKPQAIIGGCLLDYEGVDEKIGKARINAISYLRNAMEMEG